MDDLEFELSGPVSVSVNGERENFSTLTLSAPPAKEKKYPIKLRKGFMKATMSMTDNVSEEAKAKAKEKVLENDDGLEANVIEQMIYGSDLDAEKYLDDFKNLMFVPGVCKIKIADVDLKKIHWDQINIADVDRLMGEYIANFFATLWLPEDSTKS